jgi:hypothetical protein
VKLLQNHGVKLNTATLYDMAVKDYDLTAFSRDIVEYQLDKLNDEFLVKMAIVAHKLVKVSPTP